MRWMLAVSLALVALLFWLTRAHDPPADALQAPPGAASPPGTGERVREDLHAAPPAAVAAPPRAAVTARSGREASPDPPPSLPTATAFVVYGIVVDEGGVRLRGAALNCYAEAGEVRHALGSAYTAHDGSYEVRLDNDARWAEIEVQRAWAQERREREDWQRARHLRDRLRGIEEFVAARSLGEAVGVVVVASAPGHLPSSQRLRAERSGHARADFMLLRGEMLSGQVHGPLGPVAFAEVFLLAPHDFERIDGTRADREGRYFIGVSEPGLYHLHARREGVGAGLLGNVELPPLAGAGLPDLLLQGAGLLSGTALYPDGRSAAHTLVRAVPEEFAFQVAVSIPAARVAMEESEGGLFGGEVLTDRFGHFEIGGLAAGVYGLRLADLDPGAQVVELHRASAGNLRPIFNGYRLVVDVELQDGPSTVQVVQTLKRVETGSERVELVRVPGRETYLGRRNYYVVEPGERYLLAVRAAGMSMASESIAIGRVPFEAQRTVRLYPAETVDDDVASNVDRDLWGELRVRVASASGDALEGFRLTVRAYASSAPVPEEGLALALPPGPHRLRVEAADPRSTHWLPYEGVFEIGCRATTRLAVEPRRGGRLRVVAPAEPAGIGPRWYVSAPREKPLRLFTEADEPRVRWTLEAGETLLSELVEPGTYAIHVQRQGEPQETREVRIPPGETVELRLSGRSGRW